MSWGKIVGWIVALGHRHRSRDRDLQGVDRAAPRAGRRDARRQADDQRHQPAAADRDRLSRRRPAVEDHAEDLRQSGAVSTSTVGDKVTAGQVLAVLESTNMQAQLDEAQRRA